jgi:hypothetical protein
VFELAPSFEFKAGDFIVKKASKKRLAKKSWDKLLKDINEALLPSGMEAVALENTVDSWKLLFTNCSEKYFISKNAAKAEQPKGPKGAKGAKGPKAVAAAWDKLDENFTVTFKNVKPQIELLDESKGNGCLIQLRRDGEPVGSLILFGFTGDKLDNLDYSFIEIQLICSQVKGTGKLLLPVLIKFAKEHKKKLFARVWFRAVEFYKKFKFGVDPTLADADLAVDDVIPIHNGRTKLQNLIDEMPMRELPARDWVAIWRTQLLADSAKPSTFEEQYALIGKTKGDYNYNLRSTQIPMEFGVTWIEKGKSSKST